MTIRTRLVLLHLLGGAGARRHPLPLATWHALGQREWRIASTAHANSYLFRVDRGAAGAAGICGPAEAGACCGDSESRAWYVAIEERGRRSRAPVRRAVKITVSHSIDRKGLVEANLR